MKKLALIITLIIATSSVALAQQNGWQRGNGGGPRHFSPEEFKKHMELFISKEACLTPTEAQKFFPMLHEMLMKNRAISEKQRELMTSATESASEDEYEKIITKVTACEIEAKKNEQLYYKKFHTVLSWKKIYKVRRALFRFNREALRNFSPKK